MSRNLWVVTFLYAGWRPIYTPQHVNALACMVTQYLTIPHTFLCITDEPDNPAFTCPTYPLWDDPHVPHRPMRQDSFRRLKLFSAWAQTVWDGWILHIDLDVLIMANINRLITWDAFRILQGASTTPYNGAFWLHRTGTRTAIWDTFNPATSPWEIRTHLTGGRPWRGSDQGWLAIAAPGEKLYTRADGVYQSGAKGLRDKPTAARIVFFPGEGNKPWQPESKKRVPWAHALYRQYLPAL